jgi:hypothetical protein
MKSRPLHARRSRRGRTPLPEGERKARLIQARVDENLDEALRDAAKERRVTVSQLVRNVLEDTFRLVDNVVADAAHLTAVVKRDARRIAESARGATRDPVETVDAWQEVVLGRDQVCARCRTALLRGRKALMGISDVPGALRLWLCSSCGKKL